MRQIVAIALAGLSAACTMNEPVDTAGDDESKLSAEIRDYEPDGPPVSCVNMRDLRGNRSAGNVAIIFEAQGNRLYVNRPPAGCPLLGMGRALQTRTSSDRLCRGDIATVFDPGSGAQYGGCGLGDFTPYRRRPR